MVKSTIKGQLLELESRKSDFRLKNCWKGQTSRGLAKLNLINLYALEKISKKHILILKLGIDKKL